MNPILKFLQQHEDYTFDEGIAVLLRYSANVGVNNFIIRRRDRKHLHFELVRLAHNPYLRPLPGMDEQPEKKEKKKKVENQKQDQNQESETDDDNDVVGIFELKRHETYKPEDLPTPFLKELWEKNRDEYKELQHCHAQMKLANSDAGRADWRKQLVDHRESLQHRWKIFDEEMARIKNEKHSDTQHPDPKDIQNCRSYISKSLKKKEWNDETKLKVQHCLETLRRADAAVKEETLQRLADRGIAV